MSVHKSLFIGGALQSDRSVLSRRERIERLMKEGRWSEGDEVYGLPKVRTKFRVLTKKQKKEKTAEVEAASQEAAEGAEGAGGEG